MTGLTMAPIIAELMEALGRSDAAETLRWGQGQWSVDELYQELSASADRLQELTEEIAELRASLEDEQLCHRQTKAKVDAAMAGLARIIEGADARRVVAEIAAEPAPKRRRAPRRSV